MSQNTQKKHPNLKNVQNLTTADSMCVNEVKSKKKLKVAHNQATSRSLQKLVSLCLFFFFANTKEKSSVFSASGSK